MPIYFSDVGGLHFFSACAALGLGLIVLLLRKGTRTHRAFGLLYAFAMLSVNGSALMLFHMTGRFGVFHALALLSLSGVVYGVLAAIFRWKDWLYAHYRAMTMSYVGLLAAACGEAMVRVPALHVHSSAMAFGIGIAIAVSFGVGGRWIVRHFAPSIIGAVPRP